MNKRRVRKRSFDPIGGSFLKNDVLAVPQRTSQALFKNYLTSGFDGFDGFDGTGQKRYLKKTNIRKTKTDGFDGFDVSPPPVP